MGAPMRQWRARLSRGYERLRGGEISRRVAMPQSTSFPFGHSAAGAAFAAGVGGTMPQAGLPLAAAATLAAYSRVHTGVHYPADVVVGSLVGTAMAQLVVAVGRRRPHP